MREREEVMRLVVTSQDMDSNVPLPYRSVNTS